MDAFGANLRVVSIEDAFKMGRGPGVEVPLVCDTATTLLVPGRDTERMEELAFSISASRDGPVESGSSGGCKVRFLVRREYAPQWL